MTIGEFRYFIYNLDPNIELKFSYGDNNILDVKSFQAINGSLVLTNGTFGMDNSDGIINAIAKLKKI